MVPYRPDEERQCEVTTVERQRFHAAREIFTNALALAPQAREAFVRQTCGDDEPLFAETMDLLSCHTDDTDTVGEVSWELPEIVPDVIGPYRVIERLGRGGTGTVYLAQRAPADGVAADDTATKVALKVLHASSVGGRGEHRFKREIEVLRRLDHPGIAPLLDAGTTGGISWLATGYVQGKVLGRWRDEEDPSPAERVRLLAELCEAVHAAHAQGVVHRDLKPDNIMVTPEGQPVVLDFGIARLSGGNPPTATLATQTWQLLGTIRYMSPEQAAGGTSAIDERTDIYTLGVLAYELLTGALPYNLERLSTPRALLEVATAEPRPLGVRDEALALIVHHALEKEPERRYATAAEMAEDLRRYLDGRPISLRRPGPSRRLRRAWRAQPWLRRLTLAAAIAVLAGGATLALTTGYRPPAPRWTDYFTLVDEADALRRYGPRTRENYQAAIALFEESRVMRRRLPPEPYAEDMRRFVLWRLGELHYFLGEMEHDKAMLIEARGFWRDAASLSWERGRALGIPPQAVIRPNILELGRHQPAAGVAMAHANLARLEAPATNLRIAAEIHESARILLDDGSLAYHDEVGLPLQLESRAIALLDLGATLTALGATVDSLAVIERGLTKLREAAALAGLRESSELSTLCEETGVAFLRRARLPAPPAAASDLDSAQAWLDMATALRTRNSGRGYWNLCRSRSTVYETRVALARSDRERRLLLRRAIAEMGRSMMSLGRPGDDFESEISRCDLAGLTAQLAASTSDRALFARADSLVAVGALFAHSAPYPVQYAGREFRLAEVFRLRWETFGAAADSALAIEALARARGAVPAVEFPSLHRSIDEQARGLANGRRAPTSPSTSSRVARTSGR